MLVFCYLARGSSLPIRGQGRGQPLLFIPTATAPHFRSHSKLKLFGQILAARWMRRNIITELSEGPFVYREGNHKETRILLA